MRKNLFICVIILSNVVYSNGELIDYIKSVGSYFGYGNQEKFSNDLLDHAVPYEVSLADEKFISEAAKLTGVALTELDSCQHRVVLKLQTSCDKMNDEQLAKLSVMLLNCQSAIEGRKIYPCTDAMSIKDCTSSMDPHTWNSYHLMNNRARAVCYSVRQIQFRGLTEHTVNRLMEAARSQLNTLGKLAQDQEDLHDIAQESLKSVTEGQKVLVQQQRDLEKVQLHGQLAIEDNIRRLVDEKRLILETHEHLTEMTRSLQEKLDEAASQLQEHLNENRLNHQQLLDDITLIQDKAQIIFQRIEDSSELLLKQSQAAHEQYKTTAAQLAEVNATVHSLVVLVGGTRKAVEERLAWINAALGGTDLAIERVYAIMWHCGFLLLAMISCAFFGVSHSTRYGVALLPPVNLMLTLQQNEYALDPMQLSSAIGVFILVQMVIFSVAVLWRKKIPQKTLPWIKEKLTPQRNRSPRQQVSSTNSAADSYKYDSNYDLDEGINSEETDHFDFTTPIERNGIYSLKSRSNTPSNLHKPPKSGCGALTRLGTPCRLSAMPGRDFCFRHQGGDSIFAG